MMKCAVGLVCFLAGIATTHGAIAKDEVTWMPGYQGVLPNKMYSGMLDIDGGDRSYHYFFVEAQRNKETSPLLVWMNGGPGASSLIGFFTEHGPLVLNDDSFSSTNASAPLTVFENRWAWTRFASVIYLESPGGVGWSKCKNDTCGQWTDHSTADDNFLVIEKWFEGFSEWKSHDFWVSGESYAGIYVPMLADRIMKKGTDFAPNFKGVLVGNGCVGTEAGGGCSKDLAYWDVKNMRYHGMMSQLMHDELMETCEPKLKDNSWWGDKKCNAKMKKAYQSEGFYDVYNIYDECVLKNDEMGRKPRNIRDLYFAARGQHTTLTEGLNDYKCGATRAMSQYMKSNEIREALHVSGPWRNTDGGSDFKYKMTLKDVRPIYRGFIKAGKRVLIYTGDTDDAVPSIGTEYWTSNMGFKVEEAWRPWTTDGRLFVSGWVTRYEGSFDFLTVHGAGHMIPQYKAEKFYLMVLNYLTTNDFPRALPTESPLGPFPPSTSTGEKKKTLRQRDIDSKAEQ